MKILNKEEFLKCGRVLFCKGVPWTFGSLCLKGDTIGNDYYYTDLCVIDAFNGEEMADTFEDMFKNGISARMNKKEMRDGDYSKDPIYLVYDSNDLLWLMQITSLLVYKSFPE